MKPCLRVEIVIEEMLAGRVTELLQALDGQGFTVVRGAGGAGNRGPRRADELAGDTSNALFVVACENEARMQAVVAAVRPLLTRYGGVCLVSEARWLRH